MLYFPNKDGIYRFVKQISVTKDKQSSNVAELCCATKSINSMDLTK